MRKDTRLSPLFRTASDGKLSGAWERGYNYVTPTGYQYGCYSLPFQVIRVFEDSCGDEWLGQTIECCVESGDGAYRCVCVYWCVCLCGTCVNMCMWKEHVCNFIAIFLLLPTFTHKHTTPSPSISAAPVCGW